MQIADAVQNAWIMSGGIDECVTFSSDFFLLQTWCKLELALEEKKEMNHLQQKDVSPPLLPPKCTVKGAEAQTLNCFLVRGSSIYTSYTFHLLPDQIYHPHIYKMANDEEDRDIDDCFLVPCSLCKGLGRCKVFIHSKNEQIGGDLLLSTEKLAEKVRISGRRNFATNVRLSWK